MAKTKLKFHPCYSDEYTSSKFVEHNLDHLSDLYYEVSAAISAKLPEEADEDEHIERCAVLMASFVLSGAETFSVPVKVEEGQEDRIAELSSALLLVCCLFDLELKGLVRRTNEDPPRWCQTDLGATVYRKMMERAE